MADTFTVTVCFSPAARQVFESALEVSTGTTLAHALSLACRQPGWPAGWSEDRCQGLSPGLWGRKAGWDTQLRPGDRLELYRPLKVDPKVARRERVSRQGARRAGLFAQKRPGAATGS